MWSQITPCGRHLSHTEAGWGLLAPKPPGADGKGNLKGLNMASKLDTYIKIRLSKSEKIDWQEKAVRAGISLSNLIRQAMARTQTWTAADRGLISEQTRQISRIGNNLNQIAKWANTYKSTAEAIEVIEYLRKIEKKLEVISSFPSAPPPEANQDVS
ncbi:MAG: MobC family plasmid mobilization relaxosome protein [Waterburya sp.]